MNPRIIRFPPSARFDMATDTDSNPDPKWYRVCHAIASVILVLMTIGAVIGFFHLLYVSTTESSDRCVYPLCRGERG